MTINKITSVTGIYDTYIIPVTDKMTIADLENNEIIDSYITDAVSLYIKSEKKDVMTLSMIKGDKIINVVIYSVDGTKNSREIFLQFCKVIKKCKEFKSESTLINLNFVTDILVEKGVLGKFFESPILVNYNFDYYKSKKKTTETTVFDFCVTKEADEKYAMTEILETAMIEVQGTILARDLTNQPNCYMTPQKFAEEAVRVGKESGFEVQLIEKAQLQELGMDSFLSVGAGAKNPPVLVVMRYNGGDADQEKIALIGKGIMYDSGGYSLKQKLGMITQYGDMGGGAAVLGAMQSIAKQNIKANIVGIVPACENKIGPDAFVPGDVIGSMAGLSIQITSTDGEGRLILADATTYAIRMENADKLVDIATLTGGALAAVGTRTSAVLSSSEEMWQQLTEASQKCCEKVWRLDIDEELRPALNSDIADMKNALTGNKAGGTIAAGLFIKEFTEGKPWVHIDMAPVGFVKDDQPNSPKGASGYGATLLSNLIKTMEK